MTDLRQAAQQALLALEGWDNYGKWAWPDTALEQSKRNTTESLASLRAALEQKQAEPVACKTLCELCVKRGYDFCANAAKTTPIIISPTPPQRKPVQKPKYMAQSNGRHSPLLTHMMNKRTALAEPEQSFEDEQRTINADEHRRANALEEAIHAAWSAGFVEGEKAALEQQAEPECWCHKCNENRLVNNIPFSMTRMILCPTCGNKRCPKASDHRLGCTDSNAAGQPGSAYPALPQRKPLTINEVEQILAQHNYEIHGDRARYIVRMTEEAHNIKEGT